MTDKASTLLRGLMWGGGRIVETLCPDRADRSRTELSSPTTTTRGVFLELQCITGLILLTGTRVWVRVGVSRLSDWLTDWLTDLSCSSFFSRSHPFTERFNLWLASCSSLLSSWIPANCFVALFNFSDNSVFSFSLHLNKQTVRPCGALLANW